MLYKYSMNDLPNISNDYFTKRSDIQGYQTRHVNDLNLNKKKTKQTNKQTNKTKQNKIQNKTKQNKTKQQQNKTKTKQKTQTNKQTNRQKKTLFWSYRPNERSNSILWNNLEKKKA